MEAKLEYWNRVGDDIQSEITEIKTVPYNTKIELFEIFYKMNNRLRYCNGSYYKFQDQSLEQDYNEWLDSDDYKSKAFDLYYGNGVVD